MSGLRKAYATNATKNIGGFEYKMEHAKNNDGSIPTVILSRMGRANPEYSKALNEAMRPHARKRELGTLSNEVAEKVMMDVFCRTVIKGWQNIQNDYGENIPFSPSAAAKLLTELPDLYDEWTEEASKLTNFRLDTLEGEGNVSLTP